MRKRWMLLLVPNWVLVWYAATREADWIGTLSAWAGGIMFGVYLAAAWMRRPTPESVINLIVCPDCGRVPTPEFTSGEHFERTDWVCPVHGTIGHLLTSDRGQLDIGVIE